jgi:hypothetical protein
MQALLNNTLSVTAEYYQNKYYNLLITPGYATAVGVYLSVQKI